MKPEACPRPSQTCSQLHLCLEPGGDVTSPVTKCMVSLPFQMCNAEQVLAQARKRKRRTSIETNVKGTLESFFRKCVKPSPQEISQIAEDLNLDKDVGWEGSEGGFPNGCGSQMLVPGQVDTVSCGRAAGAGSRHQPGRAQPQQELRQGGGKCW